MSFELDEDARRWFGGTGEGLAELAARFAEPRERPLKLLAGAEAAEGYAFGPELRAWVGLFERFDLEVADPGTVELRAPGALGGLRALVERRGPSWLADFIGFLSAASVIVQDDETSFLASWGATLRGESRCFSFHPSDWGLWQTDPSIAARLFRILEREDRPDFLHLRFEAKEASARRRALERFEVLSASDSLPPHLDPARLQARTDWLTHVLLGVGRELEDELERAPGLEVWAAERKLIQEYPHLATYWLWAHYFFDNQAALAEAETLALSSSSLVVQESLELLRDLRAGKKVRLGEHDRESFEKKRADVERVAPRAVFEPDALERRDRRRALEAEDRREEDEARAVLEELSQREPLVKEALRLLDHLSRGSTLAPEVIPLHGGLDARAAEDRLAEIVDERFRPLILARLTRSLLHGDSHESAGYGLILAWSAVANNLAEFERVLARHGLERLGPRRLREVYRAYGRFPEARATQILARGAAAWLKEMDEWINMAPSEPVLELLRRDSVETHRLIQTLLERANFSPASVDVCVAAAVAAGRFCSQGAIRGLERAVERRLGRVDDGGRTQVVMALWAVAEQGAAPFLRGLFSRWVEAWEAADEDEQEFHERDISFLLAGLLPACPEDPHVLLVARKLLELHRGRLSGKRMPRRETLAATQAILEGVLAGEVRVLLPAVVPLRRLSLRGTPTLRPAIEALETLVRRVFSEL